MTDKVKKGRLSKVEEFYIHNNMAGKSVEEIAADLGRSVAVVTKYVTGKQADPINSPDAEPATEIPAPVEAPAEADGGVTKIYANGNMQQAIRRARVKHKGNKAGIVMTEELSILGDGDNKKAGNSRFTEGAIFKPMGEDDED